MWLEYKGRVKITHLTNEEAKGEKTPKMQQSSSLLNHLKILK